MPKGSLPRLEYQKVSGGNVATMRAMIVGEPDTGKTTLAASASLHPDLSPIVVLDVDQRLTTLAGYDNITRVAIPEVRYAEALVRDISKPREHWPEVIRDAKTFVIDSVSLFRDRVLAEYADEAAATARHDRSSYLYEQRDYGYASNVVANLIDKLIQTGNHLILLSHQRTLYQLDSKGLPTSVVTGIGPLLNKRLQDLIGSMMHHVWYTKRTDAETFRLLTLPRRPYQVKVTNPVFVEKLRDYTRDQVEGDKMKAAAEGWIAVPYMPDQLPNTLPMLWDMYKESVQGQNDVE